MTSETDSILKELKGNINKYQLTDLSKIKPIIKEFEKIKHLQNKNEWNNLNTIITSEKELLGNNLKSVRKILGYSQAKFASVVGSSQANIGRYERNEFPIPGELLQNLNQNLGVNLNWFVTNEDVDLKSSYNRELLVAVLLLFYSPDKILNSSKKNTCYGVLTEAGKIIECDIQLLKWSRQKAVVRFRTYKDFQEETVNIYNEIIKHKQLFKHGNN